MYLSLRDKISPESFSHQIKPRGWNSKMHSKLTSSLGRTVIRLSAAVMTGRTEIFQKIKWVITNLVGYKHLTGWIISAMVSFLLVQIFHRLISNQRIIYRRTFDRRIFDRLTIAEADRYLTDGYLTDGHLTDGQLSRGRQIFDQRRFYRRKFDRQTFDRQIFNRRTIWLTDI